MSFVFFLRSCGVVCDGNYSLKSAQGSGRGRPRKLRGRMSFAEGCGRRRWWNTADTKWIWISWCSSVSMSRIGIWFWHELFPSHTYSTLSGFTYRFCFGVSRKLRGSTAEGPHAQTTVLPADALTKSKPKTNEHSKRKRPKMKANEGPQGQNEKMKENVVALWSRKQELRKQGRGSSRKGYMWNACRGSWRCGRGSIAEGVAEAVNNFLSTTKEKKTKLRCCQMLWALEQLVYCSPIGVKSLIHKASFGCITCEDYIASFLISWDYNSSWESLNKPACKLTFAIFVQFV